jgi:hypothetical protein
VLGKSKFDDYGVDAKHPCYYISLLKVTGHNSFERISGTSVRLSTSVFCFFMLTHHLAGRRYILGTYVVA